MDDSKNEGKERGITKDNRKILKLETVSFCIYCPSSVDFFNPKSKTKVDKYKCLQTKRVIKNIWHIPKWCPLEDYKNE